MSSWNEYEMEKEMAKINLLCCKNQQIEEYWHDCGDTICYAQECGCGAYETLCGQTYEGETK